MPQGRGGFSSKRNRIKGGQQIELEQVVQFLYTIGSMACAIFVVCLIFYFVFPADEAGKVIYMMILAVNLLSGAGSLLAAGFLKRKDQELKEKDRKSRDLKSKA